MGYRSSIYIKVDKNKEDELCDLLSKYGLFGENGFEKVNKDETHSYYVATWLKWYEGYDDVKEINEFINENEETCALLGIGEDGAESAREGSPDDLSMWIVSDIDW